MKKIKIPSFEEFERIWWDAHPKLAESELGMNGQFDEFPYDDYDALLNVIKSQKIYLKFFNVGNKSELAVTDSKGNRVSNGAVLSIKSAGLSNINENAELSLHGFFEIEKE